MELRKFRIDGKEVEFANAFRGTRNGFAHDTTMFVEGICMGEATCHYLNRTWERYTYQTVMRKVVGELLDERATFLRERFKREKGYINLTAKRAEEFKVYLNADEGIRFYKEVDRALA